MIRIIGILVGLVFTLVVLFAFGNGAYTAMTDGAGVTAEHVFHEEPRNVSFAHDGTFGRWDTQQLQRGYQVYKEVCSACHSLQYVAFRDLADLGYNENEVKALAAQWQVPGVDDNTGEAALRPGKPTDHFPLVYPNNIAAAAANNNAIPPDLSLMAKARHHGPQYIYSLLTGFSEVPAELKAEFPDFVTPPGLHFNRYFANLNLAMAPPLTTDGQVTYADGTEATIDQMAHDVAGFLAWTAEPKMQKRKQTGVWFIGFLLFATLLAYMSYKQIWAGVKPKKG